MRLGGKVIDQSVIEGAVQWASKIKGALESLLATYNQMPKVVEQEHAAIKAHAIDALETINEDKTRLGRQIEQKFTELGTCHLHLSELRRSVQSDWAGRVVSLDDSIEALQVIEVAFHQGASADRHGLGTQVLSHLIKGLRSLQEQFRAAVFAVQPLIETNRVLTEALMDSYKQSYHFWQTIRGEAEAGYDAKGGQRGSTPKKGFAASA